MCQDLKLSKLSPLYRIWLQHSCCPAHHVGLHARYLSDLLQLLPGNLHTHPTAVCGPGSRNPLRRCPPAPHTTGIGHRATAPSSVIVSQAPYMFKNSLCWRLSNCLITSFFVSFGDPRSPRWHSQSWWPTLHRRKGVSVEDSGHDCRDLRLFPYWENIFLFAPFSWPCKSLDLCSLYQFNDAGKKEGKKEGKVGADFLYLARGWTFTVFHEQASYLSWLLSKNSLMTFFCLQGHSGDLPLELHCNGQSQRGKSISTIQLVSVITALTQLQCFLTSCSWQQNQISIISPVICFREDT